MLAVALCVVLNMLDGFDVLVMAFTAPDVARRVEPVGRPLGLLLSAGLVGWRRLAVRGALGGSLRPPGGDAAVPGRDHARHARVSAFAQGPTELAALRVFTGIGIGGILASLNVITSEYSSSRWRSTAISLQVTGYPIGATLGGAIAAS